MVKFRVLLAFILGLATGVGGWVFFVPDVRNRLFERQGTVPEREKRLKEAPGAETGEGKLLPQASDVPLGAVYSNSSEVAPRIQRSGSKQDASIQRMIKFLEGDMQSAFSGLEHVREFAEVPQEDLLLLFERALAHESPEVRVEGVVAAADRFRDDYAEMFFSQAVIDEHADVALLALEMVGEMSAPVRHPIMRKALVEGGPEVAAEVLEMLDMELSHQSILLVMDALDSTVSGIGEQARTTLDLLFDVNFESASDARNWWAINRSEFDGDLVGK